MKKFLTILASLILMIKFFADWRMEFISFPVAILLMIAVGIAEYFILKTLS